MNDLQDDGWYFLVAPLKAAHLLFSLGFRIENIRNPVSIYNDQVVGLFCLVNFILFTILTIRKKLSPKNDLMMISYVYLAVFGLTPVYAPRYFFPVTVLWALSLAGSSRSISTEADLVKRIGSPLLRGKRVEQ